MSEIAELLRADPLISSSLASIGEPCESCGRADATFSCDWMDLGPVMVPAREVRAGDVMRISGCFGKTWIPEQDPIRARVEEIEDVNHVRYISLRIPGKRKMVRLIESAWTLVSTERPRRCQAFVCESCARESAENVHYCRAHWNAWEQVK
jgi:hypothetical protein